jgi:hypothetical protein
MAALPPMAYENPSAQIARRNFFAISAYPKTKGADELLLGNENRERMLRALAPARFHTPPRDSTISRHRVGRGPVEAPIQRGPEVPVANGR